MDTGQLLRLIRKEFQLEIRQRSSVAGLGIYVGGSIFICYTALALRNGPPSPPAWSALFWIIMLFSAVGIVGKSFIGESRGSQLYMHSLASPGTIILSKIIYSALLCLLLMLAGLLLFITLLGNPVEDTGVFLTSIVLGALGFGSAFTLLSAIAARAGNSQVLLAILGFPVVLSILLMCIRATRNAIDGLGWSASSDELLVLLAIHAIAVALSYLLFPYIWRS